MRIPAVVAISLVLFACSSTTSGSGTSSGTSGSAGSSGTTGSSGREALNATAVCDKYLIECKQTSLTRQSCEQTFGVMRVTPECKQAFQDATCEELASDSSPAEDVCFPSCTAPGTQTCNGDGTITICSDQGRTLVADCAATCASVGGKTYSGTCGTSFGGQTAETDKCWCS